MRTTIWKKGGVPRAMTAPECIAKVIKEHCCVRIAEIGVASCSFCDQLMALLNRGFDSLLLKEYYLIDPWPYGYKCGSCGGEKVTNERWDQLHFAAVKRTIGHPQLRVIRMTSLEASKLFAEKYFDLVYIDADHTYESVTQDITLWLPKCSKVISGHDYSGGWQPVVDAVDHFFIKRAKADCKKFYQIDDKHYRMESGVWVVEL